MSNILTKPDRHTPSNPNSGGVFSGIVDSITHRAAAIQDTPNVGANQPFVEQHLAPLQTLLTHIRTGDSIQILFDISNRYREHLANTIYELQKLTFDRDRTDDLFALSMAISGDRGGVWRGEKEERENDFGHSHAFVETIRQAAGKSYTEELRENCREILDISDLIVLYFLRFLRVESDRIDDQKSIIIQEIIHTEQYMLARRITEDESKEIMRKLNRLMAQAPEKLRNKFVHEYRGYILTTDNTILLTPKVGKIKELVEILQIAEVDDNFARESSELSQRVIQILEACKMRLPRSNTIDSIEKSVVCFYNGISPYREIQELEKSVRSTPPDSTFSPERKISELTSELEKTTLELVQAGYESLGIPIDSSIPKKKAENPNLKDEPSATRMYIILLSRRHGNILTRVENMTPGEIASRFRNEHDLYEEILEVEQWYQSLLASTPKRSEEFGVLQELRPIIEDLSRSRPLLMRRLLNIVLKPGIRASDLLRESPKSEQQAIFECFRINQELLREIPKMDQSLTGELMSRGHHEQDNAPDMRPVLHELARLQPFLLLGSLRLFKKIAPNLHEILGTMQKISGKDANIRFLGEQFKIEWGLIRQIHEIENWYTWATSKGIIPDADLADAMGKLSHEKNILTNDGINKFIKVTASEPDLVWENPVLSNTFHDIVLFASKINVLTDSTTLNLLLMIKKAIPQSKEGVTYIRAILRSILKGPLALQGRSLTKTNIMHIARDWSTFCGFDYMLYIELCDWLGKNCILHQDTESEIIGTEIIETIRRFDPTGSSQYQDAGRVKGRILTLEAIFKNKEFFAGAFVNITKDHSEPSLRSRENFLQTDIEDIIRSINSIILFDQFDIRAIEPVISKEEDFFTGEKVELVAFPEIKSPYFAYYDDSLAFEFVPKEGPSSSIDGVFWQAHWLIDEVIKSHREKFSISSITPIKS